MSNDNPLEGEYLLNAISRHVFLVMLHISWPKMSYKIADAIVEIKVEGTDSKATDETKEIDEEFRSNPHWQLMPAIWRKRLVNLEGRARALLSNASIQFAARGMTVLPVTRAQAIFSGLRALRTEMETCRDEFVTEYASILSNLNERLDESLYVKVRDKLPEVDHVADKFDITWAIIPVGGGQGAATTTECATLQSFINGWEARIKDGLDVSDYVVVPIEGEIRRVQAVVDSLRGRADQASKQVTDDEADELINEARDQMHQFTSAMLEDMSREPRRILMDTADNLLAALRDPQRAIRNGTINQVREAFEMVEGFEFLAGPELVASIAECKQRLENVTPQQLNSDVEIGAALAAGLQGVRDEAADSHAAATAMRQFRGIKLRDKPKKAAKG